MSTVIGVFTDNKIDQVIYERSFQKLEHKFEGHVFNTPEAGLAAAREIPFDVVFIEIHFWGENFSGISILNQLRNVLQRNVIAIGVTSFLQEGDIEKIIGAGFSLCIEKPVSIDAFEMFCSKAYHN